MAKQKAPANKKSEPTTLDAAKKAVKKVAKKVSKAVTGAAESVEEHVVRPVAEAVGILKPKKKRFKRPKGEKKEPAKPAPLERGKSTAAKLMSKKLAVPPAEETAGKAKGVPKP